MSKNVGEDLISRSALREKISSYVGVWDDDGEFMVGMAAVLRGIDSAPAVDAPKWISVKDKFPEDVLADKDTKVIHCLVALEPPRSQPNRKTLVTKAQRQWNSWIKRWEWGRVSGVIYWMPLPEPPKEV